MKTEFRNRAFLPVMMPLGILLAIAAFVGLFAWILLYNTKDGALALAAVMATGILVSVALAATADELDARRRAGVMVAMGVPILIGVVLAGTGGGVDDVALLNINREEIVVIEIPDANVTIHAAGLEFDETRITLPADEPVAIIFENQHIGTAHNVAYTQAGPDGGAPETLNENVALGITDTLPGESTLNLIFQDAPGAYFYWCTIHPTTMTGTLELAEGASPAAA